MRRNEDPLERESHTDLFTGQNLQQNTSQAVSIVM